MHQNAAKYSKSEFLKKCCQCNCFTAQYQ